MKVCRTIYLVFLFSLLAVLFSACADRTSRPIAKDYNVPTEYTFAVPFDTAWKKTVQALTADERITALDRESGLLVTEYKSINNLVYTLVPNPMFGRVYKNGYTIHLDRLSPEQTRIEVRSSLILEELAFYQHQLDNAEIKAFMRQELFRRICMNLHRDVGDCATLFPDLLAVSVSCPSPQQAQLQDESQGQEQKTSQVADKLIVVPVKKLQQALVRNGYEPGPLDGVMGEKTKAALSRFQNDKGIEGGGAINAITLQALGFHPTTERK
jgi:hypothetical protein